MGGSEGHWVMRKESKIEQVIFTSQNQRTVNVDIEYEKKGSNKGAPKSETPFVQQKTWEKHN